MSGGAIVLGGRVVFMVLFGGWVSGLLASMYQSASSHRDVDRHTQTDTVRRRQAHKERQRDRERNRQNKPQTQREKERQKERPTLGALGVVGHARLARLDVPVGVLIPQELRHLLPRVALVGVGWGRKWRGGVCIEEWWCW